MEPSIYLSTVVCQGDNPLFFPFTLLNAWVVHVLYGWFVLPVFPALPAISTLAFLGLIIFKSAVWPKQFKDAKKKVPTRMVMLNLARPTIVLALAYPIKFWLM